jgi:hypothetical protein
VKGKRKFSEAKRLCVASPRDVKKFLEKECRCGSDRTRSKGRNGGVPFAMRTAVGTRIGEVCAVTNQIADAARVCEIEERESARRLRFL